MSPQRLCEIRSRVRGETTDEIPGTSGSFIGLKNIYERLNLFYEGKASMEIDSSEGNGTSVRVRIPICSAEEV